MWLPAARISVQRLACMGGLRPGPPRICVLLQALHGFLSAIPTTQAGYLLRQRLPYVFLSNTGAKGAHGVQAKLAKNCFLLQAAPVPTDNIYTAAQAPRPPAAAPRRSLLLQPRRSLRSCCAPAAQAQCAYMADHIPHHARVFVIAGGVEGEDAWWMDTSCVRL